MTAGASALLASAAGADGTATSVALVAVTVSVDLAVLLFGTAPQPGPNQAPHSGHSPRSPLPRRS